MKEGKYTILVIDDSNTALLLMEFALNDAGYNIHTASSVKEALVFLKEDPPELVLLDLSMPEISGFDFLQMRSNLHLENTPIIIVSAYDSEESIKSAILLGAIDFVPKPIHIDTLLEKIRINLKQ